METIDTFVFIFILLFAVSLFITGNITKYSLRETLIALTYLMTYHWGIYVHSIVSEQDCDCDCDCD